MEVAPCDRVVLDARIFSMVLRAQVEKRGDQVCNEDEPGVLASM